MIKLILTGILGSRRIKTPILLDFVFIIVAATWFSAFGSMPSKTDRPDDFNKFTAEKEKTIAKNTSYNLPFSLTIGLVAVNVDDDSCSGLFNLRHLSKNVAWSMAATSPNFVIKRGIFIFKLKPDMPPKPVTVRTGCSVKS